jgi:flagellar hook protein FlgE
MGYDMQNGSAAAASDSLAGLMKVNVTTSGEAANPTTSGTLSVNLDSNSTAVASTAAATLPSADPPAATANYTYETSLITYDNLGGSQTVNIYYTNISTPGSSDTWEVATYNAADATNGGFPYQSGGVNVAPLATATLTFDPTDGKLASITQNGTTSTTDFNLNLIVPSGQPMTLDLGSSTQLAAAFSVNYLTTNGNAPSSLSGISISTSGTLDFQYSNGLTSPGYEIPLATVSSEDNLTSVGGDAFEANQNSGSMRVGTAGAGGLGTVASSSLEASTVDLATELTQMIEAQSEYQANSKVFQAAADILDIINNLKS